MSGSGSPLVGTCPVVKDIREGPSGQYWDRLRQMMGPDGLMTYWYLGRVVNRDEDSDTMRVRRDMRNAAGGLMAAPLAIAAPETGGWLDRRRGARSRGLRTAHHRPGQGRRRGTHHPLRRAPGPKNGVQPIGDYRRGPTPCG